MRILHIDIDSLRPNHLGCYGYDRDTSPTIDAVAGDGVRFESCYVSDSPCLPSRTALATCRHGIENGVVTHHGSGQWYNEPGEGHDEDPDRPLSFRHLSENGLHTASVSSFSKRHLAYYFSASFRESIQPTESTGEEVAADVTGKALRWLNDHATGDDWLLHVNYWDVHHAYHDIANEVETVRASGDAPAWPDRAAIDAQQGMTGTHTADLWANPHHIGERDVEDGIMEHGDWGMPFRFTDRRHVDHLYDGYDGSIRNTDAAVARLLDRLEAAGVRDDTAVIITADHGEAMGKHGLYADHMMAHPSCQRCR